MDKERAFTLIEVLITVAILSIVLAMAVLNGDGLRTFAENQSLKTQCREVHQALIMTKNEAIMDGDNRTAYIYSDKIYIETGGEGSPMKKIQFRDNIRITSNTYHDKKLIFSPVGTVNLGGTIVFENKMGNKGSIVIQIGTGRIYIK